MSDDNSNVKVETGVISIINVIRAMAVLCIVFFFCPSFLVSCGSRSIDVSGMNVVTGIEADMGFSVEQVVEPHPIMLVALLIPIAIFAVMFLKKHPHMVMGITAALAVCDFIVWMIFRSRVKEVAFEGNCEFKTTGCFVWNMIFIVLIAFVALTSIVTKVSIDSDLRGNLSGVNITQNPQFQETTARMAEGTRQVSKKLSEFAGNVSTSASRAIGSMKNKADIMGYCQKCGSPLEFGNEFCTSCGTRIPRDLIESAEAERKEKEEAARLEAERQEELRKAEEARRAEEARVMEEKRRMEEAAIIRDSQEPTSDNTPEGEKSQEDIPEFVFCPYCGTKQDGDSVFCVACGKKI